MFKKKLLDLCAVADQILCTDLKLMCSKSLLQLCCKRLLDTPSPGHRACTKAPSAPGGQELQGSPLWVVPLSRYLLVSPLN